MDISALIVAATALLAAVFSFIQNGRSRKDTQQQQQAVNELARREQDWEELTERLRLAEEGFATKRGEVRDLDFENSDLRRTLRAREDLIARHRPWDIAAQQRLQDTDIGEPPDLYP
jgi:predicted nuclease with TOPRIM domain